MADVVDDAGLNVMTELVDTNFSELTVQVGQIVDVIVLYNVLLDVVGVKDSVEELDEIDEDMEIDESSELVDAECVIDTVEVIVVLCFVVELNTLLEEMLEIKEQVLQ